MNWRHALVILGCSSCLLSQVRSASFFTNIRNERASNFGLSDSSINLVDGQRRLENKIAEFRKSLNRDTPSMQMPGLQGIKSSLDFNLKQSLGGSSQDFTNFNRGKLNVDVRPKIQNNAKNFQSFTIGTSQVDRKVEKPSDGNFQRFDLGSRAPDLGSRTTVNARNRPQTGQTKRPSNTFTVTPINTLSTRVRTTTENSFSVFSDKELVLPQLPTRSSQEDDIPVRSSQEDDIPVRDDDIFIQVTSPLPVSTTARVLPQPILPGPVDLSQSSQSFQVEISEVETPEETNGFEIVDLGSGDFVVSVPARDAGPGPEFLQPVPAVPGLSQISSESDDGLEEVDRNIFVEDFLSDLENEGNEDVEVVEVDEVDQNLVRKEPLRQL